MAREVLVGVVVRLDSAHRFVLCASDLAVRAGCFESFVTFCVFAVT